MDSWEIDREIKENNGFLTGLRMNQIRKESCQVKTISLLRIEKDALVYIMETDDNYKWEIKNKKI